MFYYSVITTKYILKSILSTIHFKELITYLSLFCFLLIYRAEKCNKLQSGYAHSNNFNIDFFSI